MNPNIVTLNNAQNSAQLQAAVEALPHEEKFYTTELCDHVLQKQNLIVDAPSADAVVSFLRKFSYVESTLVLLRAAAIRDLIIDVLAPKISTGDPVEKLGRTICNIVDDKSEGALYS